VNFARAQRSDHAKKEQRVAMDFIAQISAPGFAAALATIVLLDLVQAKGRPSQAMRTVFSCQRTQLERAPPGERRSYWKATSAKLRSLRL
jgi:hypothetical protein